MRRHKHSIAFILFYTFIAVFQAMGHGSEPHDEKPKSLATANYFSNENSSDKYEVLIKYSELVLGEESHFTLYLSEVHTNIPIIGAKLQLSTVDDETQRFTVVAKTAGIYELHTIFNVKKSYKIKVVIDGAVGTDTIIVPGVSAGIALPSSDIQEIKAKNFFTSNAGVLIALALALGFGVGLYVNRKSSKGPTVISMFLLSLFVFSPYTITPIYAHGGEEHEEDDHAHSAVGASNIIVAKETQFLFDVTTNVISKGSFSPSVNLFGTVLPTSSGKAVVQTPLSGVIRSLYATVGQTVSKGQLIATIEQNIDANTQVSWLSQKNSIETELQAAKKDYERMQSIKDIVAKRDFDEAERRYKTAKNNNAIFEQLSGTGKNAKLILLYAPIQGKVDQFNFSIGSTVNAGQEIVSVTNLNAVYVEAQVFDKDLDNVKNGMEYIVECSDKHHTKKVKMLTMSPSINTSNQSQRVLFEMENMDGDFKIGEFVNIRVFKPSDTKNITIQNSAITEVNGKSAVFVKNSAEQYSLVYISVGESNGRFTTVIKGIEEGQKVVISGTYQLKMMYLNQ